MAFFFRSPSLAKRKKGGNRKSVAPLWLFSLG